MTTSTPEAVEVDGLVLYSDGSCKGQNPGGWLGYGVHGFAYKSEEPKKGSGNSKYVPSKNGYYEKSYPGVKPVTVVKYFDVIGAPISSGSNNTAEILAANAAAELAAKFSPKKVLIKTDSKYVINGVNEWAPGWIKRGYKRADGSPVPNATEWQALFANVANLKALGTQFEIKYVEGHSTHLGNNTADKLAGIGSEITKGGGNAVISNESQPEGYWKPQEARHSLLAHRSFIFSTMKSTQHPGEYYLTTVGKSDELVGKAHVDTSYAVVQLAKPEPVIEMIRSRQSALADYVDFLVLGRLDRIYGGSNADDLVKYGENCLTLSQRAGKNANKHLYFITEANSGEPLTEALQPPMLAHRAIVALSNLKTILDQFKAGEQEQMSITDITDEFYTSTEKKGVVTQELKKEISITMQKLKIDVNAFGRTMPITFILGLDLPPRNNLKRLSEESSPIKMSVVCIKESDQAFRHHLVIQAGDNWSIWSGFYSNLMMFKDAK